MQDLLQAVVRKQVAGPHAQAVFGIERGAEERQAADVIPMGVREIEVGVDRTPGVKTPAELAKAGAAVKDEEMLAAADLETRGVAAIAHGLGAGAGDAAANPPEPYREVLRLGQSPIPWAWIVCGRRTLCLRVCGAVVKAISDHRHTDPPNSPHSGGMPAFWPHFVVAYDAPSRRRATTFNEALPRGHDSPRLRCTAKSPASWRICGTGSGSVNQTVTARFGDQDLGLRRVLFDLLAQTIDMGLQRMGVHGRVVTPHLVQ